MKHVMFAVDLKDWKLDSLDDFAETMRSAVVSAIEEVLTLALEDDETYAYFPAEWGDGDGLDGAPPSDPLTVYVRFALMGYDEPPTYSFSLRDALKPSFDCCEEDGSFADGLRVIADGLRALSKDIDAITEKWPASDAADA